MTPLLEQSLDLSLLRLLHLAEDRQCPELVLLRRDLRAKTGFWKGREERSAAISDVDPSFPHPAFVTARPDYTPPALRPNAVAQRPQIELRIATEKRDRQTDYATQTAMEERTAQFFLRNVPRVQRDVDLTQALRFEEDENERHRAYELIQEVREAEVPRPEFAKVWTSALSNDFRVFLEEVLFLCPWEEMPRQLKTPDDNSTWSPKHSRAKLTYELMERQHNVFVFGHGATPQTVRRHAPKRLAKVRSLTPLDGDTPEPMA